jgi:hypothetical protein
MPFEPEWKDMEEWKNASRSGGAVYVWNKMDICNMCYNSLNVFIVTSLLRAFVEKSY